MFDSFDMSKLEVGDVIHVHGDRNRVKGIIMDINTSTDKRLFIVAHPDADEIIYTEMDLKKNIELHAYWINKAFAGLELI